MDALLSSVLLERCSFVKCKESVCLKYWHQKDIQFCCTYALLCTHCWHLLYCLTQSGTFISLTTQLFSVCIAAGRVWIVFVFANMFMAVIVWLLERQSIKWTTDFTQNRRRKVTFQEKYCKQKLAYTGHVIRGCSGLNALLVLVRKFDGKKQRGQSSRTWRSTVDAGEKCVMKLRGEDNDTWRKIICQPSDTDDGTWMTECYCVAV